MHACILIHSKDTVSTPNNTPLQTLDTTCSQAAQYFVLLRYSRQFSAHLLRGVPIGVRPHRSARPLGPRAQLLVRRRPERVTGPQHHRAPRRSQLVRNLATVVVFPAPFTPTMSTTAGPSVPAALSGRRRAGSPPLSVSVVTILLRSDLRRSSPDFSSPAADAAAPVVLVQIEKMRIFGTIFWVSHREN